jgi:hypothetical protein
MTKLIVPQETTAAEDDIGIMAELGHTGDIKYYWNRRKPEEVAAAEEHFKAMKAKGFLVFKVTRLGRQGAEVANFSNTGKFVYKGGELAHTFDPKANYVATPPAVGG